MMSYLLAEDRARQIWGDQVHAIHPDPLFNQKEWGDRWTVVLLNGSYHGLDGNGHAICHQDCADCEVQVCK